LGGRDAKGARESGVLVGVDRQGHRAIFCQNKSKIDEQQMLFADAFAAYGRGSAAPYGEIMH